MFTGNQMHQNDVQPELLTDAECAVLLRVSFATFRRLIGSQGFPAAIRLAGSVRWNRADVLAWALARADGLVIPQPEGVA